MNTFYKPAGGRRQVPNSHSNMLRIFKHDVVSADAPVAIVVADVSDDTDAASAERVTENTRALVRRAHTIQGSVFAGTMRELRAQNERRRIRALSGPV